MGSLKKRNLMRVCEQDMCTSRNESKRRARIAAQLFHKEKLNA